MGAYPFNKGIAVLEYSFLVGTGGVYRWRGCIIEAGTSATPVGDGNRGSVKLPTTAFTAAETFLGVVMGPANTSGGSEAIMAAGLMANVRLAGLVPMQCDTSVASTNIGFGDWAALSAGTSGDEGKVAKATRSTNSFAASQHIAGLVINKCTVAANFAMVHLRNLEI